MTGLFAFIPVTGKKPCGTSLPRLHIYSKARRLSTSVPGQAPVHCELARAGIRVIGVDFSEGMLRQAMRKSVGCSWIHWVQADARALPLASCMVDRVTCSYAMYELSGKARHDVLREVTRILKPAGMFVMMEHLPPRRPVVKLLYLIRIYLLGSRGVRSFAGSEEKELRRFFSGGWNSHIPWRKDQGSLRL